MRRTSRRPPLLLPMLTLVLLSQAGCQSGFFGPCGPCANKPLRRFGERIFNRNNGCCGAVGMGGGTVISDVPVIEGAPAVVTPAPILTPGVVIPGPSDVSPQQIEPIPPASSDSAPGGEAGGTRGAGAPASKLNYEAARTRSKVGLNRGGGITRTFARKTPAPTSRSASGAFPITEAIASAARKKAAERGTNELSLLDDLPPLDLPREEIGTSSAAVTDRDAITTAAPVPEASGAIEAGKEKEVEVATVVPDPSELNAAPGLRRFAVIEPKLAGGSLPSSEGLDWLVEKGYRTLIDLREPSEVQPSFIAEVSRKGMRYLSLPINLATLDRDLVARFHFEISLSDARPIYFFDAEGNRPGMLWYIHRMSVKNDSYDPQEATRQADELGLSASEFREAAQAYLARSTPIKQATASPPVTTSPAPTPTATAVPQVPSEDAREPGSTCVTPEGPASPAEPESSALPEAASFNLAAPPTTPVVDPDDQAQWDPNAWRPFLALLLTGLGGPVAYWSRSNLSFRALKRASLPAPARRLRSLPSGSGE